MLENQKFRPAKVIGPLGEPLTLDLLPSPDTNHWIMRRKAEVVAAVNGGLLTLEEACERYQLTVEEFASWQRGFERAGMRGLRATHVQYYRDLYQRQQRAWSAESPGVEAAGMIWFSDSDKAGDG